MPEHEADAPSRELERAGTLTTKWKAGGKDAFDAILELFRLLLSLTVADHAQLKLVKGNHRTRRVLAGPGVLESHGAVRLNDGRYLLVLATLQLNTETNRVKVDEATYQYQLDSTRAIRSDRWIFRYDYHRDPVKHAPHPSAHLQVNGVLSHPPQAPARPLPKVHFPTGRISLESVIRTLIEQFGCSSNTAPSVWRPVLSHTESVFLDVAHTPLSGPAG